MTKRKRHSTKPATNPDNNRMVRRNVTFSTRHATLLDREREQSGVSTSTLLRQLIEQHFKAGGGSKQ